MSFPPTMAARETTSSILPRRPARSASALSRAASMAAAIDLTASLSVLASRSGDRARNPSSERKRNNCLIIRAYLPREIALQINAIFRDNQSTHRKFILLWFLAPRIELAVRGRHPLEALSRVCNRAGHAKIVGLALEHQRVATRSQLAFLRLAQHLVHVRVVP